MMMEHGSAKEEFKKYTEEACTTPEEKARRTLADFIDLWMETRDDQLEKLEEKLIRD